MKVKAKAKGSLVYISEIELHGTMSEWESWEWEKGSAHTDCVSARREWFKTSVISGERLKDGDFKHGYKCEISW